MSWHKLFQTGSALALAVATTVYPLTTAQVLASPLSQDTSAQDPTKITQGSTPAPTAPPATPAPATPAPATPAPATPAPATTPATRADVPGLIERVEYINACRQTNRSVEVFADTALSSVNRVGTLEANAQITLTGVLAPGRAQILRRESPNSEIQVLGWVNSAYLTTCGSTPPPPTKVCYQVNVPVLTLRSAPSSASSYQGTISAGSIVFATSTPPTEQTSPNTPPDYGRIWVQVYVRNNLVWIARTGQSGVGNNVTQLSDTACTQ